MLGDRGDVIRPAEHSGIAEPAKMSRFMTSLVVKIANDTDDGMWEVEVPLAYESDVAKQIIIVPPGFKTDFASVPRLPIIYEAFGNHAAEAAVVHDYLYTTKIVTRDMADAVLREAAGVQGVSAWRAWCIWAGVRIGGGAYWDQQDNEPPYLPGTP